MKPTYPYYLIPYIEALPSTPEGEERQMLIRRIAALMGDSSALREILGLDPEEFINFYPDQLPPDLSTSETIDTFIDKYGSHEAVSSPETQRIEELVPLPPADYDLSLIDSSPLIIEGDVSDPKSDQTSTLLESFLDSKPAPQPKQKKEETPVLSESLARAMIKNGNYRKALEIITDLSLKNPKKSIYFADQIRFLKKLILNQSKSQN